MKKIIWKKLSIFEKGLMILGWANCLNIAFWIAIIITHNYTQGDKFINPDTQKVPYVFGWITLIGLGLVILDSLFF